MNRIPVGGRKRRSWRLRKKRDKWFRNLLPIILSETINLYPDKTSEAWSKLYEHQDYSIINRLFI